jgi:hypothetical protein
VHPAPAHVKPLHDDVVTAGHAPALQLAAFVTVPPEHVCARHCAVEGVHAVREAEQLATHIPEPPQAVRPP